MAKSKKPAVPRKKRRGGLSGLGDIPREIRAIVPGDAKQYAASKEEFRRSVGKKECVVALTSLANAAFSAGVARAAAVARGEPKGAEQLYADFLAQRDEYLDLCHKKK